MLKEMKRKLILKKLLTKENKYLLGYLQTFSPLVWTLGWVISGFTSSHKNKKTEFAYLVMPK